MAMNPPSTNPLSWFYIFSIYFFLFTNVCCISSAFFLTRTSYYSPAYNSHCASMVPESTPTFSTDEKHSLAPFVTSYFTGGDRFLAKKQSDQNLSYYYVGKSLGFPENPYYSETQAKGIYNIEAYLYIKPPYRYFNNARRNYTYDESYYHKSDDFWSGSVVIAVLSGFWSENSRILCMVGAATWKFDGQRGRSLDVVLKLNYPSDNPTMHTSIISGTFRSTILDDDLGYFEPISIFCFPTLSNYNYTLVSKELEGRLSDESNVPKNHSLSLLPSMFCSMLSRKLAFFELQYAAECKTVKDCSPFGEDGEFLPRFVSLNPIQCSQVGRKLRYLITFQNISYAAPDQTFGFNRTLIGEGSWDDANNELFIVACRILDPANHLGNALGDCTIRLSLRYPLIWNVRNNAKIVGQIWTNNTSDDLGYFRKIKFTSCDDNDAVASQGLRYEYTELERARELCPGKKLVKKARNVYPNGHSHDMRFDMSINTARGQKFAWGEAMPLSVGNQLYVAINSTTSESNARFTMSVPERTITAPLNISYKINVTPFPDVNCSMNLQGQIEITAEGVYDAETGLLCMVGCRKLLPYVEKSTNDSSDCQIAVSFEFAPLNDRRGGLIKGTIQSTRAKADPLYFDVLSLSSGAYYPTVAKKSIWRMDMEIAMVLISDTLLCIFVALQLFHVKSNPDVLSGISLVMLLILSIGHLIPLVLNFEHWFSSTGWLETSEVAIRVVTIVAFLLQIRLLQLVWTAKMSEDNEKKILWLGEKKTFAIALPMYFLGGLLTLILNRIKNSHVYSLSGDLRSYAGLILDGFLLPQILLNAFRDSTEKALSVPFYIGTSTIRLAPHAYDFYRAHIYPTKHLNGTYYYGNPTVDFYSIAWDIIIPCGVMVLAVIIFLQQRYGGCCILPKRFRELGFYEKVPAVNNE